MVTLRSDSLHSREAPAERSLEMTVDVNSPTIGIAASGFPSKIASRPFDRPVGSPDVLDDEFRFASEEAEDRTIAVAPIFLFELRKLMSNTPHRLWRRIKKELEPSRVKADGGGSGRRFCGSGCRQAFWTAARRWVMRAVETGLLSSAVLKAAQTSVHAAPAGFRSEETMEAGHRTSA